MHGDFGHAIYTLVGSLAQTPCWLQLSNAVRVVALAGSSNTSSALAALPSNVAHATTAPVWSLAHTWGPTRWPAREIETRQEAFAPDGK